MPGNGPGAGVVVVAAGSSTRMRGVDKAFAPLAGTPLIAHCLRAFEQSPLAGRVALVLSEANIEQGRDLVRSLGLDKVARIVVGGRRRQDSVRIGLDALTRLGSPPEIVMVHDGARPFVDAAIIERGVRAVANAAGAAPAIPLTDTVKVVDACGVIRETPDRSRFRAVQTPQVFHAAALARAHRAVSADVTDDAAMVEATGGTVRVFEGASRNFKVTTPEDLLLAEMIASQRSGGGGANPAAGAVRHGIGFDGHRLAPGLPLMLGGVRIPFEEGLEGHSDGDVLLHAIGSAILGGAGLGDLGARFPSSDPGLAGIDSGLLVERCAGMAAEAGWLPRYVDATIIAQRPALSPYLSRITARVAGILRLSPVDVNVKVTSTDHVGAIGQGEGIAAQASATMRPLLRPDPRP